MARSATGFIRVVWTELIQRQLLIAMAFEKAGRAAQISNITPLTDDLRIVLIELETLSSAFEKAALVWQ
jgi:hypothetical protein